MDRAYNILIVDDNAANLYLLEESVRKYGFNPISVTKGKDALAILEKEKIDAILLDIMMPGMSGWDVLEEIKKRPAAAGIPVIMVSALDNVKDIVSCLEAGADDYISKPFSPEILHARLSNCLERKRLIDKAASLNAEIEEYNVRLEVKVEEKTRELAEAYEKLRKLDKTKADFMKVIAHELRTPLTGLQASAELLFEGTGKGSEELISVFRMSYDRLSKLIEQTILISKLDHPSDIDLQSCKLKDIVMSGFTESDLAHGNLKSAVSSGVSGKCRCDPLLMTSAFREIFNLSVRLSANPGQFTFASPAPGMLEIHIVKPGILFKQEELSSFFDIFTENALTLKNQSSGVELGPLIASKILNVFSGTVTPSQDKNGIVLTIKVPVY